MSSSSESEAPPANMEITMAELNDAARKEYPILPAVMNSPVIQKSHWVLRQDFLTELSVRYRFEEIDPRAWQITDKRLRRDLSPKEPHSNAALIRHEEFEVRKNEVRAKVKDLRAHGY